MYTNAPFRFSIPPVGKISRCVRAFKSLAGIACSALRKNIFNRWVCAEIEKKRPRQKARRRVHLIKAVHCHDTWRMYKILAFSHCRFTWSRAPASGWLPRDWDSIIPGIEHRTTIALHLRGAHTCFHVSTTDSQPHRANATTRLSLECRSRRSPAQEYRQHGSRPSNLARRRCRIALVQPAPPARSAFQRIHKKILLSTRSRKNSLETISQKSILLMMDKYLFTKLKN